MSNDTPFNATMPPNMTLTSQTASSGEDACAVRACTSSPHRQVIGLVPMIPKVVEAGAATKHELRKLGTGSRLGLC